MRLIDADALIKRLEDTSKMPIPVWLHMEIINAPIAQSERTGKWQVTHAYPHNVHCSVCHKRFAQTHWAVWEDGSLPRNYCPNCGARMLKKGEDHETD